MDLRIALALLATLGTPAAPARSAVSSELVPRLTNALQRAHGPLPQAIAPNIADIPLRGVLATATQLRAIAEREGLRDEFDARMDPLYTYVYTLERRRQFSRRAA